VDIAVAGDYAYVADNEVGLCVVDVANPSNPVLVGITAYPIRAADVIDIRSLAYVATITGESA